MARKQRRMTRTQMRDAQLVRASRIDVPPRADVCVIGGGAAGLVAGIVCAERGSSVVVLERDLECGRTILATGNGRCNMANATLDPECYNDSEFVHAVCGNDWLQDVGRFFRDCGLAWTQEAGGRLYPMSRQAASVREVLLERAGRASVVLAPARTATAIRRTGSGFEVRFTDGFGNHAEWTLGTQRVVLATGGNATLDLARDLGLAASPFRPLLCPMACESMHVDLAALDGRRVHANAHLLRRGNLVARESGEVLFRRYGISGIAVFNLSRYAETGDMLELDLIPELSEHDALELAAHTLAGILDPVVAQALSETVGTSSAAVTLAKRFPLRVTGLRTEDGAQVRRGGLVCEQFDPTTLEAHSVPGFFACGEALDVDGPCGGFNLAWAWKSGMVAGMATGGTSL